LTGTNTYAGNVTINNGTLQITSQNGDGVTGGGLGLGNGCPNGSFPNNAGKIITLNSATSELDFLGTNGDITVDPTISFQTAGSVVSDAGNNEIEGSITLRSGGGTAFIVNAGGLTLLSNITVMTNVSARALTLGGTANGSVGGIISDGSQLTNTLSLAKEGAGMWTLSNANTYSGSTTISNGTLALGPSGSISGSTNISLQGGTLNVAAIAGSWTFAQAQTLSGFGAVTGNVTADGTVAPGGPGVIGTLTFANQLSLAGSSATFLALNRTNTPSNADRITVATLVRGGTLTVTNGGDPLQGGDSFTLFSAGSASGSFTATNLPALSSTNLFWDTSVFGSQGIIKIGSHMAAQPHITSIVLAGTTLTISGTNGTGGNQFAVLTSTNAGTPLNQWKPLVTNTFTSGNFSVPITVNPAAPQNYYILRTP
jgi:autotransporter-associated beta strand protein